MSRESFHKTLALEPFESARRERILLTLLKQRAVRERRLVAVPSNGFPNRSIQFVILKKRG